jgi:hypothetical protein
VKSSIETEKIIRKAPSPIVMYLTRLAMSGKVDKDGVDRPLVAKKSGITCFEARQ